MKVVKMKLADLVKPEKNVRIHTEQQLKEFRRSVTMFGQIRPIVVDEKNIILAGNGLYDTLVAMGRDTADVYRYENLTENQKKKLMIADNIQNFQKWRYSSVLAALHILNIRFYTALDTNLKIREYKWDICLPGQQGMSKLLLQWLLSFPSCLFRVILPVRIKKAPYGADRGHQEWNKISLLQSK